MASNRDRSREQTEHEEFETELTKHEADDRVHRSPQSHYPDSARQRTAADSFRIGCHAVWPTNSPSIAGPARSGPARLARGGKVPRRLVACHLGTSVARSPRQSAQPGPIHGTSP